MKNKILLKSLAGLCALAAVACGGGPGPQGSVAVYLGIPELVAFTFVGNGRSRRVMQKLGMTCVGEFDHPALPEGHPLRRHALYRIRTEQ